MVMAMDALDRSGSVGQGGAYGCTGGARGWADAARRCGCGAEVRWLQDAFPDPCQKGD